MQFKTFSQIAALCGSLCAIAGCQSADQYSPEMADRAVAYNQAVASTTNQMILLNIVRAGKREPRYFTRFGANQAQTSFTGSLTASFPFSPLIGMAAANSSAGLTPTGSSGNTVTLDNLDDRKYQVGANAPIDMSTVEQYWSQGLQSDALGLLFVDAIWIPAAERDLLTDAFNASCAATNLSASKYCFSRTVPVDITSSNAGLDMAACLKLAPQTRRDGDDYLLFINDPSWDSKTAATHPETCYIAVLRGLLAMGLHPEDIDTKKTLDKDLDDRILADPKFRADMIKASLTVKFVAGNKSTVTEKKTDAGFAIDPDSATSLAKQINCKIDANDPGLTALYSEDDDRKAIGRETPEPAHAPAMKYRTKAGKHGTAHPRAAVAPPSECHFDKTVTPSLEDLKIDLHVRSFEAIIYYLGEILRSEIDLEKKKNTSPVSVTILGRAAWARARSAPTYEEPIFAVEAGSVAPAGALIVVRDLDGTYYWTPGFCDALPSLYPARASSLANTVNGVCSTEYPNHETLTVLTIVNQLWGLQKEPDDKSPSPTLSLGK